MRGIAQNGPGLNMSEKLSIADVQKLLADPSADNRSATAEKVAIGFGGLTLNKVLSVFGFIDHGRVTIEDPQPGEKDQSITGAGAGIRLNIPKIGEGKLVPSLSFNLVYGGKKRVGKLAI